MPDLGFVLGLAFSAAVLGRAAAGKRNRNVALWGAICFCFPIAVAIIWSMDGLPPREQRLPNVVSGGNGAA